MANVRYSVDYAKRASNCKKCKQSLEKGSLRLAKLVPNPFSGDGGDDTPMKEYYHSKCLFEKFKNARATTKVIESAEDVENWAEMQQSDKADVLKLIQSFMENRDKKKPAKKKISEKLPTTPKKPVEKKNATDGKQKTLFEVLGGKSTTAKNDEDKNEDDDDDNGANAEEESSSPTVATDKSHPDNSLKEFRKLCSRIASVGSHNQKTEIVKSFIKKGSSGKNYEGDLYLLIKLLLPGVVKRVYNINSKQLVKHFSQIFGADHAEMLNSFNSGGDISETVESYFRASKRRPPCNQSTLSLQDVDAWLEEMTRYTKEEDQQQHLADIAKKCTAEDLQTIVRLLKHDLRITAGAKHILSALDPNAHQAFQASRNLKNVITKILNNKGVPGLSKALSISVQLGTPVLPMLAEACRSVESAMKKCPNGMFAEIKYDGERVQVHKKGSDFVYYSRSLKPVQPHKVELFKDFIPKAFPGGGDLILDAEVLMIDTKTSKPLPFGTLGVHKKTAYDTANVCLFVFDCLLFQSQSLMDKSLRERKAILEKNMIEIPNRILFSEMELIKKGNTDKLRSMINRAINDGLEGLVLKDIEGIYEPGKRHWLKVKKDYLEDGSMADSADLIVLGAFYGTGNKGGLMSVFLMGCYDPKKDRYCTVTKCGNGHDDATIDKINKELKDEVVKISKDYSKLPDWLMCNRQLVPDFVVKDPKKAPVWEIAGAEFSASDIHTADGISIRFPRVTKIRDDKTWKTATNLQELKVLYAKSKERSDLIEEPAAEGDEDEEMAEKVTQKHSLMKKLESIEDREADRSPTKSNDSSSVSPSKPSPSGSITPKKRKVPDDDDDASSPKSPTKSNDSSSVSPSKPSPSSSITPKKRKVSDDDDDESSPKKARTACKYGSKCYQKNPDHKATYFHPDDKPEPMESKELFSGLKFYLSENLGKRKDLVRYVNFFGGDVVDDIEDASHVVPNTDEDVADKVSSKAKIFQQSWLWDCIKKRKLLPQSKS